MNELRGRSVRSLAWLGDAYYEQDVRFRLLLTGDWPTARLDRWRSDLVRAESQADILAELLETLDEAEQAVVRRGRNTSLRSGGRVARDTRAYRAATGFEALVAYWKLGATEGQDRYEQLVGSILDDRINQMVLREREEKTPGI